MNRTQLLQETRKMHFEEILSLRTKHRLTQEEAARMLGVSDRTFRRYVDRYNEGGLDGLLDKRLTQESARKAPADEAMALVDRYRSQHKGWNVMHFHAWYQRDGGTRSYSWVKNQLQAAQVVPKGKKRGAHRKKRERSPLPGMMIHQDGSTHEWVPGKKWDLIVTMDDATNEHYSMFFTDEEGTASSFAGVKDVLLARGLFCSFYSDRGSHYWHTPEAGGKVDKKNLTQFGRAMHQLGIEMIPAYSPEARGRSERAFSTHQDRLVKELAFFGITEMAAANHYLRERYLPAFNAEFMEPAPEQGSGFVPLLNAQINDILCEQHERTVGRNNCVTFERITLQIPQNSHRCNYIKVKVRIHRYPDRSLAIFHGPRKLADYHPDGKIKEGQDKAAA
ncbi:ISNCY family transposase [Trichloromonas acetexigens]|jgi:transposase|uniref:ISNCY family transposase n=1 Tax=Trichloromonas acetexigens TaxID=38815 RepID=A0A550JKB9_9BACT|nr:ISNCY family transposase [Desulfuromonas acetexigens]TRO83642.1 ISNCY family transposase [Desulfuromonas acetexigens]